MKEILKVVSGSFSYCCKRQRELKKQGYVLVFTQHWSDGKYSFKFLPKERV